MTVLPTWLKTAAQLPGHAVDPGVLWAVQWILGVLGIVWAFVVGFFISFGGAAQLTGALYSNLISTFHDYHVIGAVNVVGGLLGVFGLAFDKRFLSVSSAGLCAVWNGLLALYLIPENFTGGPDDDNVLGFYALFVCLFYLLRIVLLCAPKGADAIRPR